MTLVEKAQFTVVDYTVRDGVAWIVLNRPDALNAFSTTLYGEVKTAVRVASDDPAVDMLVITGTGRAFATGGDLKEVLTYLEGSNPLELYQFEDNLPFDTVRYCPKVTIAAINGLCMAGGLITAMSTDVTVAVESATFAAPEARVGMAESWMPNLMFGRLSIAKMKYLLLTGKAITASEAERIGLITEVVPDQRALEERVNEIVKEIRASSPVARTLYKRFVNDLIPRAPAADVYSAMRTPAGIEGLRAFAEKRPARYGEETSNGHS